MEAILWEFESCIGVRFCGVKCIDKNFGKMQYGAMAPNYDEGLALVSQAKTEMSEQADKFEILTLQRTPVAFWNPFVVKPA